jgi:phosphatidylethanolamine/phosphatidyl-N-methylethanolamine N-methyltransferase
MSRANAEIRRDVSQPTIRQFLGNLLRDPIAVGAVAPSSRHLANLMVTGMKPGSRVIELGAGTGAVTEAILDAGVHASDLTLVEQNENFAAILSSKYPDTTIVRGNAVSLRRHICTDSGKADFVVSGLPLLLFPARSKARLLSQVFKTLSDEGCLYQYTYGVRCPVSRKLLRNLNLAASLMKFTPFNVPPAFVYKIARA